MTIPEVCEEIDVNNVIGDGNVIGSGVVSKKAADLLSQHLKRNDDVTIIPNWIKPCTSI